MDEQSAVLAARLRAAVELHEFGLALMRQNMRRRRPLAAEATIDSALGEWLQRRPGAEYGDCPGPPGRLLSE